MCIRPAHFWVGSSVGNKRLSLKGRKRIREDLEYGLREKATGGEMDERGRMQGQ